MTNEELINYILSRTPKDQKDLIFSQDRLEIDGSFLGFVDIYYHLSKIIPKCFTVIDFGCSYAPQSVFFEEHKEYIGIDEELCVKFTRGNSVYHDMSIQDFIKEKMPQDTGKIFAICSHVPDFSAAELVRQKFENVFTFYPSK